MEVLPIDARVICNLMLDEADSCNVRLSNLALQKLLYFAHARCLIEVKKPLVSGYFEAWKYGPVHPAAYSAFKSAGENYIEFRAKRQHPLSGKYEALPSIRDDFVSSILRYIVCSYGKLTPGRLVEVSHAKDAPWHFVVEQARSKMAFGLRISDSTIIDRFKFHKVSVGVQPMGGEPSEDAPFA